MGGRPLTPPRAAGRAVREQEARLERAATTVARERAELKRGSPTAARDYELEMNVRLAREQQRAALAQLRDLAPQDPGLELALQEALATLGLTTPQVRIR